MSFEALTLNAFGGPVGLASRTEEAIRRIPSLDAVCLQEVVSPKQVSQWVRALEKRGYNVFQTHDETLHRTEAAWIPFLVSLSVLILSILLNNIGLGGIGVISAYITYPSVMRQILRLFILCVAPQLPQAQPNTGVAWDGLMTAVDKHRWPNARTIKCAHFRNRSWPSSIREWGARSLMSSGYLIVELAPRLLVCNVHLDVGDTLETAASRLDQLRHVIHIVPPDIPLILMGDFNAEPRDVAFVLKPAGFTYLSTPEFTYGLTNPLGFNVRNDGETIDQIWGRHWSSEATSLLISTPEDNFAISDHYGVYAKLAKI
jgi:endonuclease/exonuclease/phosphatase family metal-dependent hydrolase